MTASFRNHDTEFKLDRSYRSDDGEYRITVDFVQVPDATEVSRLQTTISLAQAKLFAQALLTEVHEIERLRR